MKKMKIILLLFTLSFFSPYLAFAEGQQTPRLITVTGSADVMVVPNEAALLLGVETQHKELQTAKSENDARIEKIFAVAKNYAIKKKNIKTNYITIEPRYEYQRDQNTFIGFFVKQSIVLTIEDLTKFENILSDVLKAGANYVHGIRFRTTELKKIKAQARSLAIKTAQEKARKLAADLGQKIGRPYSIQEKDSHWSGYQRTMAANAVLDMAETTESSDNIALGQIKVNAKVLVSFELEQ